MVISLEPAYKKCCREIPEALKVKRFSEFLILNLYELYDPRKPAILFRESLELKIDGRDYIFLEIYYTAAVCQVIRTRVTIIGPA